ncbi:MAG: radical SAM protein [Candidatus Bipolaricaulis sp.]|nr:radical SAM protein [Candidatus Bipolaricaulis sp.]MDD5219226.1 radical SAM protein [Candidatus Bipolaricaulis sp.]MDD5646066.1 radical SAM protein [Candidatus Bipolaricaulis sp.]
MIREIHAKTILSRVAGVDTHFGLDYGMNLYRGCQHHCIYCDSRSECYGNDRFDEDVLVKVNAVEILGKELRAKRRKGVVGTGSMNDPYMPLEEKAGLTRAALEVVAECGFGVHVVTKSDRVLRDIPVLQRIARTSTAAVSLTITTMDDDLARRVEPGAPPPSARFSALARLSEAAIETRIALMPVLPFLEDTWDNVSRIVEEGYRCGVRTVIPWFGMSLRDRQRSYFYHRLDESFPGLRERYEKAYGCDYVCPSPRAVALRAPFEALCARLGIRTSVRPTLAPTVEEPQLFG